MLDAARDACYRKYKQLFPTERSVNAGQPDRRSRKQEDFVALSANTFLVFRGARGERSRELRYPFLNAEIGARYRRASILYTSDSWNG